MIALLTDFGLRDHYVAAMKGVMLGICPRVSFLDISHEIAAQDVAAGALELESVVPYLPAGTVVLAVVDPGVGSSRRGLVAEAGALSFVGPDNGLLVPAMTVCGSWRAVSLEQPRLARPTVASTFEGRDRFALAAAWLASGVALDAFGPAALDLVPCRLPAAVESAAGIDGQVVRVDHFGNLVTNIPAAALMRLGEAAVVITAGEARVHGIVRTYSDAPDGALCALLGSTGHLEIATAGGSAAAQLRAGRWLSVQVRRRAGA